MDDLFSDSLEDNKHQQNQQQQQQQHQNQHLSDNLLDTSFDDYEEINFLSQSGSGMNNNNTANNLSGYRPSPISSDSIKLNFQFDDSDFEPIVTPQQQQQQQQQQHSNNNSSFIKSPTRIANQNNHDDYDDDDNDEFRNDIIDSLPTTTETILIDEPLIPSLSPNQTSQQQQQQSNNKSPNQSNSKSPNQSSTNSVSPLNSFISSFTSTSFFGNNNKDKDKDNHNNEISSSSNSSLIDESKDDTTSSSSLNYQNDDNNNNNHNNNKSNILRQQLNSSAANLINIGGNAIKKALNTTQSILHMSTDMFWNDIGDEAPGTQEDTGEFEKWLKLGEDISLHCWTKRLDHQFPEHKAFQVSIGQGFKLMGLGYRMWKYVKRENSAGRVPIMDPFNIPKPGPVMGVPIGGIGSGSITRGWRGDFVRWNLKNGMVNSEVVDANKFSVYIKMEEQQSQPLSTKRATVLCPGKPKSNFALDVWNWSLKGDRSSYFGQFPRAWTVYEEPHQDVRLVCKQVSPVIPNNYKESSYPCGVFVWKIENTASTDAEVSLMFTWQNSDGTAVDQAGGHHNKRFKYTDEQGRSINGVTLTTNRDLKSSVDPKKVYQDPLELSIGVRDDADVQFSFVSRFETTNRLEAANLWYSFNKSGVLDNSEDSRPSAPKKPIGAAIAAKVLVKAGTTREVAFSVAWDTPVCRFNSGSGYYRRYTKFFGTAGNNSQRIACDAVYNYRKWEEEIVRWQHPILSDPSLPTFYKQAIFNELYYFVDGGTVWTHGAPDDQPNQKKIVSKFQQEDLNDPNYIGRFAYLESVDYLMYNTYDVHFYASFALAMLWPRLELSLQTDFADATLLDYSDTQVECIQTGKNMPRKVRGAVPHDLGNPGEDPWKRVNAYHIQDVSRWKDLPSKFVLQIYRDYLINGNDRTFLLQMWGVVEEVIRRAFEYDIDIDGVIDNEGVPDQTYDAWSALGCSAYSGGLWLAAVKVASEMARILGLKEDETVYKKIFEKGKKSYSTKLWNGHYFNYDSSKNPHFDSIMSDQLAGHWYLLACGLPSYITLDQALSSLSIINEYNVKSYSNGSCGAVNGMRPEGGPDTTSLQSCEVWIGTSYGLASTMLLHFMDNEAWELIKGLVDSTYNKWGFQYQTPEAWDQNGLYRAGTYMRPLAICVYSTDVIWSANNGSDFDSLGLCNVNYYVGVKSNASLANLQLVLGNAVNITRRTVILGVNDSFVYQLNSNFLEGNTNVTITIGIGRDNTTTFLNIPCKKPDFRVKPEFVSAILSPNGQYIATFKNMNGLVYNVVPVRSDCYSSGVLSGNSGSIVKLTMDIIPSALCNYTIPFNVAIYHNNANIKNITLPPIFSASPDTLLVIYYKSIMEPQTAVVAKSGVLISAERGVYSLIYVNGYVASRVGNIDYFGLIQLSPIPFLKYNVSTIGNKNENFEFRLNITDYMPTELTNLFSFVYAGNNTIGYLLLSDLSQYKGSLILSRSLRPDINLNYPVGIGYGTIKKCKFNLPFEISHNSPQENITLSPRYETVSRDLLLQQSPNKDIIPPSLNSFTIIPFGVKSFIIQVNVTDDLSGFYSLEQTIPFPFRVTQRDIVLRDSTNGIYEKEVTIPNGIDNDIFSFTVSDFAGNFIKIGSDEMIGNFQRIPRIPFPISYTIDNIVAFKFKDNILNVTGTSMSSSLFFVLDNNNIDYQPTLTMIIGRYGGNFIKKTFTGYWNSMIQSYQIDFTIQKNFNSGPFDFYLESKTFITKDVLLFKFGQNNVDLNIISNQIDMIPPKITKSIVYGGINFIGWLITIEDSINGLSEAYINVTSDLDLLPRQFKFTPANLTSGSKFSGTYQISIPFNSESVSETYSFANGIKLIDEGGNIAESIYLNPNSIFDPFGYQYSSFIPNLIALNASISNTKNDTVAPSIVNVRDKWVLGNRNILYSCNFTSIDLESGISYRHIPVLYLSTYDSDITAPFEVIPINKTHANYTISVEIPRRFVNQGYFVRSSIYGVVDNVYIHSSLYMVSALTDPNPYDLKTVVIESASDISTDGGVITLYGNGFGNDTNNTKVSYISRGGSLNSLTSSLTTFTRLITTIPAFGNNQYIDIIVDNSSPYRIIPTLKPTPTSTPTPTNTIPPSCPNSCLPNGECTSSGCKCKSGWVGTGCSFSLIDVVTHVNSTTPTTIQNDKNSDFLSLVSIDSIRELDSSGNVIERFDIKDRWSVDNFTTPISSKYIFSRQISNNRTTIINVTLEYFESDSNYTFGNQEYTIYKSSMKYSVVIDRYSFKDKLNTLQLVMNTSISTSDTNNLCSSSEITGNGVQYLNLRLGDKVLSARFINYGVIDYKVQSVNNIVLESSGDSNNGVKSSLIAMNIPNFDSLAWLDPDFSLLVDQNQDKSNNVWKPQTTLDTFGYCDVEFYVGFNMNVTSGDSFSFSVGAPIILKKMYLKTDGYYYYTKAHFNEGNFNISLKLITQQATIESFLIVPCIRPNFNIKPEILKSTVTQYGQYIMTFKNLNGLVYNVVPADNNCYSSGVLSGHDGSIGKLTIDIYPSQLCNYTIPFNISINYFNATLLQSVIPPPYTLDSSIAISSFSATINIDPQTALFAKMGSFVKATKVNSLIYFNGNILSRVGNLDYFGFVQVLPTISSLIIVEVIGKEYSSFNSTFYMTDYRPTIFKPISFTLSAYPLGYVSIPGQSITKDSLYLTKDLRPDINLNYPVGIATGTIKNFDLKYPIGVSLNSPGEIVAINSRYENSKSSLSIPSVASPKDTVPPSLNSFTIIPFIGVKSFIIQVNVTDDLSGFYSLEQISPFPFRVTQRDIVLGNSKNGIYEKEVTIPTGIDNDIFSFTVSDLAGNLIIVGSDEMIGNFQRIPRIPFPISYTIDNIVAFKFKDNILNVTGTSMSSSLFFVLDNNNIDYQPTFTMIIGRYGGNFIKKTFTGYWNSMIQSYQIDFTIQKNFNSGPFDFYLESKTFITKDVLLFKFGQNNVDLNIISNQIDMIPPKITKSIVYGGTNFIGWLITIEDSINGLSEAYINVTSDLDLLPRQFKFTPANLTSGSKFSGTYQISIPFNSESVSETYSFANGIKLIDEGGNIAESIYLNPNSIFDPFGYQYSSLISNNISLNATLLNDKNNDTVTPSISINNFYWGTLIDKPQFNSSDISTDGGVITLYGNGFGNDTSNTKVNYIPPGGSLHALTSSLTTFTRLITTIPAFDSNQYIDIIVKNSMPYRIIPKLKPTPTPTPTSTPTPTNTIAPSCPNSCLPNGECTSNGCKCKSGWVGTGCSFSLIDVVTHVNSTTPTTIQNDKNSDFLSLVSIDSIRELDSSGNVIERFDIKDHWSVDNFTTPVSSKYIFSRQISNNRTTIINVTLEYFESDSNYTFGNQEYTIYKSSMKYSVVIDRYSFKDKLNTLQLVMNTSISTSDTNNLCSSSEITGNGVQYLNLRLGDKVLSARFINYGVIDYKVQSVNNIVLESSGDSNNGVKSSLIAMNIPNFDSLAWLDPDFSLLVDQNQDKCKSSGLTTSQIIGIAIGSALFLVSKNVWKPQTTLDTFGYCDVEFYVGFNMNVSYGLFSFSVSYTQEKNRLVTLKNDRYYYWINTYFNEGNINMSLQLVTQQATIESFLIVPCIRPNFNIKPEILKSTVTQYGQYIMTFKNLNGLVYNVVPADNNCYSSGVLSGHDGSIGKLTIDIYPSQLCNYTIPFNISINYFNATLLEVEMPPPFNQDSIVSIRSYNISKSIDPQTALFTKIGSFSQTNKVNSLIYFNGNITTRVGNLDYFGLAQVIPTPSSPIKVEIIGNKYSIFDSNFFMTEYIPTTFIAFSFKWVTYPLGHVSIPVQSITKDSLYISRNLRPDIDLNYPVGIATGTIKNFALKYPIAITLYSPGERIAINSRYENSSSSVLLLPVAPTMDTIPPSLNSFTIFPFIGVKSFIIQVNVTDDLSGFYSLEQINPFPFRITQRDIVLGNSTNGIYEKEVTIPYGIDNDIFSFTIYDIAGNFIIVGSDEMIGNFQRIPRIPFPISYTIDNIVAFKFKDNILNVTGTSMSSSLFFVLDNNNIDYQPTLTMIIGRYGGNFIKKTFTGYWNSMIQSYQIDFTIQKNFNSGPFDFYLESKTFITKDVLLFKFGQNNVDLNIISNQIDMIPPKITKSIVYGGINFIGWLITIEDSINGLSEAYINVTSDLDLLPRQFKFTPANLTSGSKFSGTYQISIPFNSESVSETYSFANGIKLIDEGGNIAESIYSNPNSIFDPFGYQYSSLISNNISLNASIINSRSDSISPTIIIDSWGLNSNLEIPQFNCNFTSFDLESGISYRHIPVLCISTYDQNMIVPFEVIPINKTHATYSISANIPRRFALPGYSIQITIFGVVDNSYNHASYDGFNAANSFPFNLGNIIIESASDISTDGGVITLYGNGFGNDTSNTRVNYIPPGGSLHALTSSLTTFTRLITTIPAFDSNQYIDIIVENSMPYRIIPTLKPTPTPTSTPTPTNTIPPSCPNSCLPNGECTSNGCKCKSGWVGTGCSFSLIDVVTHVNSTTPTTIQNDKNSDFLSLVSIDSIRELDSSGNVIERFDIKDHWSVDNFTTPISSKYIFSRQISNNRTTIINVTLEYFESDSNYTFGNQEYTIYKSSMKYSVVIDRYSFKDKLNTLQLVMNTSISTSDTNNLCSSSEITGNGVQYLNLRLGDKVLSARFINYGVIDYKVQSVNNIVLESSGDSNNGVKSSLIAMNIPNFDSLAWLDPDFSLLVDQNQDKCKSSGLTTSQIIGIAIGSALFLVCITIAIVIVLKKRYSFHFKKGINMVNLESTNK
ncbi:hypothetical protein PPL_00357 [Heterostelium album PN500]|uniref:EGF-like domain-containing protein n=1 Tax=Heterostelium pallidum (strain ATCC 26659 / Pp 5 / PN500) TaxID=670386 RepID=D3AW83_HETP5|nr:hypothetical protein PPL_00357 [Heterostelium album PN500]EFA86556.1 hypothetical protein PPL_00357 [Heterostelium album PN500]|eukprot:XP_020438661.1 hypothetical protein PPL_00357 [Heterostelium album PN500]